MPRPKKTETPVQPPQSQGLSTREEQLLDMVVELEERLAKVEGGQTAVVAKQTSEAEKLTAELDAEALALAEEFKDFSGLQVLARRVDHGVDASNEIRFTDEPPLSDDNKGDKRIWRPRWFNFSKDGRAFEAAGRGWEKCRIEWLRDPEAVTGGVKHDEFVRRGDRGQEVLMRMPEKWYRYLKRREQLQREGKLSSESSTQSYLANQVAAMAGATGGNADQAGSFVASKGFTVEISEGQTERDQVPV